MAGEALGDQQKLVEIVQASGEKSVALNLVREGKKQTIEVTPQRRKSERAARVAGPRTYYYELFRPGAVVANQAKDWEVTSKALQGNQGQPGYNFYEWRAGDPKVKQSKDDVSKRLDSLDSELKQLRKAIEELSKAVKDK
jgi:hypothetical protein